MSAFRHLSSVLAALAMLALPAERLGAEEPIRDVVLPEYTSLARLPFPIKVPQRLHDLKPKGEPFRYDRTLPIFGSEMAAKGYLLPKPYGLSAFSVYNEQVNIIEDISVALGIDNIPPPDAPLVPLPFVTIGETISYTTNTQLKVDAWILPFLNVFLGTGYLSGHADLTVSVDLDAFLPPPICNPANPCGTVQWPFSPDIDGQVMTIGATGVYSQDRWFAAANLSHTLSTSDKRETDIKTTTAGLRAGWIWPLRKGLIMTTYAGATYMKSDNIVRGYATAPGTLPGGQTLNVRYEIRQYNRDRWAAVLGMGLDFKRNLGLQLEVTHGPGTSRGMVSTYVRF